MKNIFDRIYPIDHEILLHYIVRNRPGHIIHNPEPNPNPNRKTRTRPVMDPSKYPIGSDMLILWLSGSVRFNPISEIESEITEVYVLCR